MYLPNQEVVCIDDNFSPYILERYTALPVKDRTYTVRDVIPGIGLDNKTHQVAVLLEELTNPLNNSKTPQEYAFNIERFAPLDPNYEVEIEESYEPAYG